ncbi:AAA family ATPase [Crassaminicella profunda]|uniref:AAA family ATPase n=1 Tax=Crassaminicella profunda TaxID=1286698 RepID=UPI001CA69B3F|nr:AAA family ATPase [Crassaminicella profunda]QZY53836.1 AAA family ATPase [Crassaminicella profunda]
MKLSENNQYLRSIRLLRDEINSFSRYPFDLPIVNGLSTLTFHPRVTFVVGENGTGKSTLLEAIATSFGFNPEGGTKNFNFSSRDTHSELYEYIRLSKGIKRPKDGFFLRAESFYNLATNIEELDKSGGGPRIIDSYGGTSLHAQSHGESFFATFINRFSGRGLYILDEPEAALSPFRQMSMISRIHQLVQEESQFIIATHSPIIMAYPDAMILQVNNGFKRVNYEETEHYQIMKQFMNNREKMLNILMES